MNFFQISLTSNCNLSCSHCPMAEYRNTMNDKYKLTNSRLIPWITRELCPNDWVIELTGGEPALYEGIDELVRELSSFGYKGLIKTNGLLPIKENDKFKRIAAFHQLNNPPKFYDSYLIIDKLDRELKESYCKENNIPYKIIGYKNENPDKAMHGFRECGFMDPHGHPMPCKASIVKYTEWPDKYALEYTFRKSRPCCSHCKAAIDAWRFLNF